LAICRQGFESRSLWNSYFLSLLSVSKLYVRRLIPSTRSLQNEVSMLDLMFIAVGLGFLAVAMLYAAACNRL
jgi:hypothetical protein